MSSSHIKWTAPYVTLEFCPNHPRSLNSIIQLRHNRPASTIYSADNMKSISASAHTQTTACDTRPNSLLRSKTPSLRASRTVKPVVNAARRRNERAPVLSRGPIRAEKRASRRRQWYYSTHCLSVGRHTASQSARGEGAFTPMTQHDDDWWETKCSRRRPLTAVCTPARFSPYKIGRVWRKQSIAISLR